MQQQITSDCFTAPNAMITILTKTQSNRDSKPSKSKYGFRLMEPT